MSVGGRHTRSRVVRSRRVVSRCASRRLASPSVWRRLLYGPSAVVHIAARSSPGGLRPGSSSRTTCRASERASRGASPGGRWTPGRTGAGGAAGDRVPVRLRRPVMVVIFSLRPAPGGALQISQRCRRFYDSCCRSSSSSCCCCCCCHAAAATTTAAAAISAAVATQPLPLMPQPPPPRLLLLPLPPPLLYDRCCRCCCRVASYSCPVPMQPFGVTAAE